MLTIEKHKKIGKCLKEAEVMLSALLDKTNLKSASVDKVLRVMRGLGYVKCKLDDELTKKQYDNTIYYGTGLMKRPLLNSRKRK